MGLRSFYSAASKMKEEGKLKEGDLQNMNRQARYDTLFNQITELERQRFMLQHGGVKADPVFYKLEKDIGSSKSSDEKVGLHLSIAKGHIRRGEGVLSKNMDAGESTYGFTLQEIKYAEKELEEHKDHYDLKELKKEKEELANFAEALARKIKMDVEKKDQEYSLKKDLKEKDKKELEAYQNKYRVDALKKAEEAVNYAKKLVKD